MRLADRTPPAVRDRLPRAAKRLGLHPPARRRRKRLPTTPLPRVPPPPPRAPAPRAARPAGAAPQHHASTTCPARNAASTHAHSWRPAAVPLGCGRWLVTTATLIGVRRPARPPRARGPRPPTRSPARRAAGRQGLRPPAGPGPATA